MGGRFAAFVLCCAVSCSPGEGQEAFRGAKGTARPRSTLAAPIPFRAVGSPPGIRLRASADGIEWTAWQSAEPGDGGRALVFFGDLHRYLETDSEQPVELLFIDPGVTPGAPVPKRRPLETASAPAIVTREQWGCTPQTCPSPSDPVYTTVTHLIVHHTAGANSATDWAAVVRSIWVLHVQGNGWNDIGYNYLVDPTGVVYEGRAGGDGVMGAHFSCVNGGTMGVALLGTFSSLPVPAPALDSVRAVLAWQAAKWKIDPSGKARHAASGLMLDTISGHRDANLSTAACGPTECPGNGAYVDLPSLRAQVDSLLAGDCPAVVSERNFCAPAEGGAMEARISVPAACKVETASAAPWLDAQSSGGTVVLKAQPNTGARRSATALAGGRTLAVTQAAAGEQPLACVAFNGIESAGRGAGQTVAAGSLISIYGSNLATPDNRVSVAVDGRPAPLLYVSPTQINIQIPAATAIGSARLVVTSNGQAGPEAPFSVTEAMPALFVTPDGRAIALNTADGGLNGPSAPVAPGAVLSVYLTGIAASTAASATVGGRPAGVRSVTSASPGVIRLDVLIPADAPPGEQPVVITAAGASSLPALVTVGSL